MAVQCSDQFVVVKHVLFVKLRLVLMSHSNWPELFFFYFFELGFRCVLMSQSNPPERYVFIFT